MTAEIFRNTEKATYHGLGFLKKNHYFTDVTEKHADDGYATLMYGRANLMCSQRSPGGKVFAAHFSRDIFAKYGESQPCLLKYLTHRK